MIRPSLRRIVLTLALVTLTTLPERLAHADAPPYPDTAPGRHARAYFPAYDADEGAMRAFWAAHGSKPALAARPVDVRIGVWKDMRAEHGHLTPLAVAESGDDFVAVRVKCELGPELVIRFVCADDAEHGLVALQVEDADAAPAPAEASPPPVPAGPPPSDAAIVAALSAEVDSLARANAFAGTVLLDKDGATLYAHAAGEASRERHEPMRMDTRMNVGSIDKIFTSVAIQQLAQAGKLGLDDTIDRWLTDYPESLASKITVRMLLDHKSGVPDALHEPALWKDPLRVRTMADWYALVRTRPLDFAPGTHQQYSNGGYVLLGMIVARAAGEDYYDYIKRHIATPAGMTRTDFDAIDDPVADRATSYPARGDKMQPGRGSSAGGGYATVGDLVRFARALRAGKLLDAAHTRDMLDAHPGMAIAGGAPGVNGLLQLEGPYTLAVLSNLDPPAAERFMRTTGLALRRAGGGGGGAEHTTEIHAGQPRR